MRFRRWGIAVALGAVIAAGSRMADLREKTTVLAVPGPAIPNMSTAFL